LEPAGGMAHEERTLMDETEPTVMRSARRGPGPSPADIADDADRRADAYGQGDREEVAVVDGYGARIAVERGHLELHDGVGGHRRVRRYTKLDAPRRLVVGIGTVGAVTFDALRWCSATGTSVVALGRDGGILAAGPPGREDARLLRAQALALYTSTGVDICRYLITEKLGGQARVLRFVFGEDDAANTVIDLRDSVDGATSIDEIRQLEAAAANVYFAAWERKATVRFVQADVPRIPDYWAKFNGRRSAVNPGSPRSATNPAGAILNYAYKLAEIEAALAARRMGLDPGIGILHADVAGRPSFACDLMEAVRPVVDAHVLGVLAGPLRKREFTEDARGVVHCMAPITHRLAEAMPSYGQAVGPTVETVASMLADSSPYDVSVPSVLTGAKHRAAARKRADTGKSPPRADHGRGPNPTGLPPRRKPRPKVKDPPPLPTVGCSQCGEVLPVDPDRTRARRNWCDDCLPSRRAETIPDAQRLSLEAARSFELATGTRPTHTTEATEARSAANARQRAEQLAWASMDAGVTLSREWWVAEIFPRLSTVTLPAMARATGASTSAASKWRAGRTVPHQRHWEALAGLAGVELPES